MGALCSCLQSQKVPHVGVPQTHKWSHRDGPELPSQDPSLLKPDNLGITKLESGARVHLGSDEVQGQQVDIVECENADIYVLDNIDSVNIDECRGCRIVLGPVSGSVALRDSIDCTLVVICQQFRSRDSRNCFLMMHAATRPVIEDCMCMKFGCFDFNYFNLPTQLRRSELSIFNNCWYDVFDFTPDVQEEPHWEIMSSNEVTTVQQSLLPLSEIAPSEYSQEEVDSSKSSHVIPVTLGVPAPHSLLSNNNRIFILFPSGDWQIARSFINSCHENSCHTLRTRETTLRPEVIDELVRIARESSWMDQKWLIRFKGRELGARFGSGPVVGMEVIVSDDQDPQKWLEEAYGSKEELPVLVFPDQAGENPGRDFFDNMNGTN